MKYIITEDKFNSIFDSYLDRHNWRVWDYSDNEISVYDTDGKRIFYTEQYNEPEGNEEKEFVLKINNDFADEVAGMFGELFDPWKVVQWFNNSFKTNCVTFDYWRPQEDF